MGSVSSLVLPGRPISINWLVCSGLVISPSLVLLAFWLSFWWVLASKFPSCPSIFGHRMYMKVHLHLLVDFCLLLRKPRGLQSSPVCSWWHSPTSPPHGRRYWLSLLLLQ